MDFSKQKAEDWLDDLETVGNYAVEKIGDVTKDTPIVKSLGAIYANPTKQEVGTQIVNLASATNKNLQESFGGDPVDIALNYGPGAMGTIYKGFHGGEKFVNDFSRGPERGKGIGSAYFTNDIDVAKSYAETGQPLGAEMSKKIRKGEITTADIEFKNPITDNTSSEIIFNGNYNKAYNYFKDLVTEYDKNLLEESISKNNIDEFWEVLNNLDELPGLETTESYTPFMKNRVMQAITAYPESSIYKEIKKRFDGIVFNDFENKGVTYIPFSIKQIKNIKPTAEDFLDK